MTDEVNSEQDELESDDIAIIGMACRLPCAKNPDQFWDNLLKGKESITTLNDAELQSNGVSSELIDDPNYVKSGMFLEQTEMFDAGFFGLSPLDAKIMDPQHRQFLECSWEAFEDAGYDPSVFDGAIGVYCGSGHNAYMPYNLLTNPQLMNDVGFFLVRHTGNDKDFLATRVSYNFNLKGPSVNVQSACSTSLVGIHMAAQSLLSGECDMALAGGVTIEMPHHRGYLFKDSEILSPDGHCRPFEANSKGTVFGSGAGVVILRRLEDALANRDHIHAVIKSSAINNDGANKVSYLAPSVDGQAAAIREALDIGDIDPQSVSYIECHGTGTLMGDPIEVAALTQAYGDNNAKKQYCGIGSVKSNIGHLDTAAGVASLIKVVQALKHKTIPATLHYKNPNPAIDFSDSPFYVNAENRDWLSSEGARRAGVSSLGVGGTNAHLIVEEAPSASPSDKAKPRQLLLLSARSEKSLQKASDQLAVFLDEQQDINLADVSYTLATGRQHYAKRRFAVVENNGDAISVLDGNDKDRLSSIKSADEKARKVAFMFAGGGAQYTNMGRELYESESIYRQSVDESLGLLDAFIDFDLKSIIYPEPANQQQAQLELEKPSRTLPALFITQYAQAKLWLSWGVSPSALIGHSMGENTAACLAGVLSLKDALGLIALRGKLFESIAEGGMLSVQLDEKELQAYLGDLDIAAVNAPGMSVVSGPRHLLDALETELNEKEISCQRVHINIAAHSRMLEPILGQFGDYLKSISLNAPEIPFISNRTGSWITAEEASNPEYWVEHLRNTIRFDEGAGELLTNNDYVLLEVGPGTTLSSLTRMNDKSSSEHTIVSSLPHPDDKTNDLSFMLSSLGCLWQGNGEIDWSSYFGDQQRNRLSLPTYAFDHARHWVEPGEVAYTGDASASVIAREDSIEQWLYHPVWHRSALTQTALPEQAKILVLSTHGKLLESLASSCPAETTIISVTAGSQYKKEAENVYQICFENPDDYLHLIADLAQSKLTPNGILHALAIDADLERDTASQQYRYFDSLFYLAKALGAEDIQENIRLLILSAGLQQVAGEHIVNPAQALMLGPARVIPREFENIQCSLIDIERTNLTSAQTAQRLLSEFSATTETSVIAYRGLSRYSLSHEKLPAPQIPAQAANTTIKTNGVYLITGGTGGLGLIAAKALADEAKVKLVLMSRRAFPEKQYWQALISQGAPEQSRLLQIQAIEASGSEVLLLEADVADLDGLQQLKSRVEKTWGPINGILHTAGVIDDSLIQLKEMDAAQKILQAKVYGTLAIQKVFDPATLDFMLLYGSSSAITGLIGQVDYAAANAFLDAFAHAQNAEGHSHVVSVNWPAWKNSGMAASIADGSSLLTQAAGSPVEHPLLDRCIRCTDKETIYSTLLSVDKFWLLSEHRIKDAHALIPGTGYLEFARAAYCDYLGNSTQGQQASGIEIRQVAFILPFVVGDHETKELRVQLQHGADHTKFAILSDIAGEWIEHVTGTIQSKEFIADSTPLPELNKRCHLREQLFSDPDHHPQLDFGPRWASLQKINAGDKEAIASITLASEYKDDLQHYKLHPAIMDMATAGAQILIDGYDSANESYVPVGYERLEFCGEMPEKLFSHIRYKPQVQSAHSHDIAVFDVTIYDEHGQTIVKVTNFSMQRVASIGVLDHAITQVPGEIDPGLKKSLELGITDEEGAKSLLHILKHDFGPQLAVSPYNLDALAKALTSDSREENENPLDDLHDPDADADIANIEKILASNEAIEAVVVRSHLDEDGSRRLIAHYLPDDWETITISEFRKFAKAKLDAELVPQAFIEHDEFPFLDDGAVDRTALLDPFEPEDTYQAPRTTTEKVLAKIWGDVLGVKRISMTDNFFDVGGHSLLSIRVIVKAEKKFGVKLDQAKMVLQTLEQLSREIESQAPTNAPASNTEQQTSSSQNNPEAATTIKANNNQATDQRKKKGLLRSIFGKKS